MSASRYLQELIIYTKFLGAFLVALAGCRAKIETPEAARPQAPALQALPAQSLKGLNLAPIPNPATDDAEWVDLTQLEPQQVVFTDYFLAMDGCVHQVSNSGRETPNGSRSLTVFWDPKTVGNYKLEFAEDAKSLGADGKPGVLSISWSVIPTKMDYSGFTYSGIVGGPVCKSDLVRKANTRSDLKGIYVRFKCKSVNNQTKRPTGVLINFNIEPDGGDQYANRLDFENIQLTDEWTYYQRDLSQGKNTENFLRTIKTKPDSGLRMIWSQVGGIDSYQPGDSVLIDDIEIFVRP